MKTQTKIAVALAMLLSSGLASATFKIDVGSATFGAGGDADTVTGAFTELAFNQTLATSFYETSAPGVFTGVVLDTNVGLGGYGIPTAGLLLPSYGQATIGNLSPLTPPQGIISDAEGFGVTWGLVVEYGLSGTIPLNAGGTAFTGGPSFNAGFYNVFFDNYTGGLGKDFQVLGLTLQNSILDIANLTLNFKTTFAKPGFLLVDGVDASTLVPNLVMTLDTNVNPPIPNPAELVAVNNGGKTYGARQTTLDGSIRSVPEPTSIALLGLGLMGFAAAARRKAA